MPRRSAGCEKCRQRKVRCDEAKPHCRRCFDYGVTCPGYRPPPEKDLHFVDQTKKVSRHAGIAPDVPPSNQPSAPNKATRKPKTGSPAKDTELRWRHQFSGEITPAPGPDSSVNPRHLHRVQLLSTFLDLYLPKRRDRSMMSHFTYITALPTVDLSSPLLQISIDTLCLAELGSLYGDQRCLQESRSRYVRALPMLAHELAKPEHLQLRKDHILAAISVLALCELFDALARGQQGGQGWISHVQGAQMYIKAHYKEVMDTPFGWLLFHNIRHMSLCMGMVRRKASYLADPQWLRLTQNDAKKDAFVGLYDLCIQVPGLLERADDLSTSDNFDHDFYTVCRDILDVRAELAHWIQNHYINKSGVKYRIVDVRDMQEFSKLCPNRTFMTVFSFPSVQVASQYQLFWVTCVMLDFTIANIYRVYKTAHELPDLSVFTPRSKADLWRDMYVAATNYCRCIPYCCEPETSSIGRIGTFLLRIVSSFFTMAGYERELEWCSDIRKMLEGHSFAKESAQQPSSSASASPSSNDGSTSPAVLPTLPFNLAEQGPGSNPPQVRGHQTNKPLPIKIEGQYPNTGYTPRMPRSTSSSTNTITNALPTPLLNRLPSTPDLELNATRTQGFHLLNTTEISSRIGVARLSAVSSTLASPDRASIHGASVLADERVMEPHTFVGIAGNTYIDPRGSNPSVEGYSPGEDDVVAEIMQGVESTDLSAEIAAIAGPSSSLLDDNLHHSSGSNDDNNHNNEMNYNINNGEYDSYVMNDGNDGNDGDDDAAYDDPSAPPPIDLQGVKQDVQARRSINANCTEEFIDAADLDRCLVGSAPILRPEGQARRGAIGAVCF